jgi:hypothetical protein
LFKGHAEPDELAHDDATIQENRNTGADRGQEPGIACL